MNAKEMGTQFEYSPSQLEDFQDPIEFLYYDHARIRLCCERRVELGDSLDADGASATAAWILNYFENEFPLHLADEEEDLFRLLNRRSRSDDRSMSALKLLCAEHQHDIECGRSLMEGLRPIACGGQPLDAAMFRDYVHAYAMLQRRHHAMENNDVLPLAAERFTPKDLCELGRDMPARRGLRAKTEKSLGERLIVCLILWENIPEGSGACRLP